MIPRFHSQLLRDGFAVGSTHYADRYPGDEHNARIVVTVASPQGRAIEMIVDTGAPWCILDPELAEAWNLLSRTGHITLDWLNVRGERFAGRLVRANLTLQADAGEDLMVEATIFVPILRSGQIWPYPNFLGLDGFLSRIRFAVDPIENAFYFGCA